MMVLSHVIIGIVLAFIIWKLVKITFKTIFWLIVVGIILHFILPGGLFLVSGIGFLFLIIVGGLLVLSIVGFLFWENDSLR